MQLAVLQRVLDVRPVRLTVPELIRELAGEEVEFAPVMRLSAPPAIYPVLRHLHLDGDLIFPTRAAIRNREMLDR